MIWYALVVAAVIPWAYAANTRAYWRGWDDRGVIHDSERRFYEQRIRCLTDLLHTRP